jgi:hypothetical protein
LVGVALEVVNADPAIQHQIANEHVAGLPVIVIERRRMEWRGLSHGVVDS